MLTIFKPSESTCGGVGEWDSGYVVAGALSFLEDKCEVPEQGGPSQ